jgi:hypothetical protein
MDRQAAGRAKQGFEFIPDAVPAADAILADELSHPFALHSHRLCYRSILHLGSAFCNSATPATVTLVS